MDEKSCLVVGDAVVDLIVQFPRFLNEERTDVEYPSPCMQGGGTSANTAVALARLGIPTSFLGTVGDDQYGRYVAEDFRKEGVGTEQLIISPSLYTICVFAFIDERGERYLWGWPREKQAFKEIDFDKIDFDSVRKAAWVHSSGMAIVHDSSSRHSILRIMREAHDAGVPTSFDLNLRVNRGNMDEAYRTAVLEAIKYSNYVLGSGNDEFYYLGPCSDWRDSARSFVTPTRTVVARMGEEGSMAMTPDQTMIEKPFPVQVVDTVGAGDAYNAGFIAARLAGRPLRDCLVWGNAVSSYKVAHKGARSTPSTSELDDFMKSHGH